MKTEPKVMSNFEWAKNMAERFRGYTITPAEGGDWKLVWFEHGERFEAFETELGVIAMVDSWCEEPEDNEN